jgi:hypothetical protein
MRYDEAMSRAYSYELEPYRLDAVRVLSGAAPETDP